MHRLVIALGKHHGEYFHVEKAYEIFLYDIFLHGPVQELCKLAGLPEPVCDTE
ncbi:MAG: TusE/DsrC/DsvC family sulfur relay protein [Gammaproteobacteria bacterium]|nr:TusE/DsrC/DsvC family sulfur relay protein [Gammaproteobacteria bacterium]